MKKISSNSKTIFILIAAVSTYWIAIFVSLSLIPSLTHQKLLHLLGVPALQDWFVDLYGPVAWIEITKHGLSPFNTITEIHFPSGQSSRSFPMNYPSIVLFLGKIGLHNETIPLWGITFASFFYLTLIFFLKHTPKYQIPIAILFILSPLTTLLIERANLDILLLILLLLAILLSSYPILPNLLPFLGSTIKLFPILALLPSLQPKRKEFIAALFFLLAFFAYLLIIHSELRYISSGLKSATSSSFGVGVISNLIQSHLSLSDSIILKTKNLEFLFALILFFSAAIAGAIYSRKENFQILFSIDKPLFGLITGSSIYCSAFLFGPQMDYKWTFLLLCLPGVLTLAHQIPPWSHLARCWLICALLYAYWLFFSSETSLRNALFRQAFSWSLFGLNSILIGRFWLSNWLAVILKPPAINKNKTSLTC